MATSDWFNAFSTAAGLGAAYLGSEAQRRASEKAVGAVKEAGKLSAKTQEDMFEKSLALGEPYRELGAAALPAYTAAILGHDPTRQRLDEMAFGGELYELQKEDITESINRQLAARGRLDSGAGLQTLSDAYRRLGAQEAEAEWGRALTLTNLDYGRLLDAINIGSGQAGMGAGLASSQGQSLAGLYTGTAANTAGLTQDVGAARASLYGGINQAIQGGLSNYYTSQLMEQGG